MKFPKKHVGGWARELIEECFISQQRRRETYKRYRMLYEQGSDSGPAKDNECFPHIDQLASYLFSPAEVRFDVSFAADETAIWRGAADMASSHLTKEFKRNRCGLLFSQAVEGSLVDGARLLKLTWDYNGYKPFMIKPEFFGVLREDLDTLDEQDAFCYRYYLTPSAFGRMMANAPNADKVKAAVALNSAAMTEGYMEDSYFHEIITGGVQPIGVNASTNQRGSVSPIASINPQLAPDVAASLIQIDEMWAMNDEARDGKGDWHCVRMAGDVVIDGEFYTRNLFGVPGAHPFVKVCPNETAGYFWGRPELKAVAATQEWLNERTEDVDRIFKKNARPSMAFTGFASITDEKARIMQSVGGYLTDNSPGGKVDVVKPDMPSGSLEYLAMIRDRFQHIGGFTPTTSGQGDPGVRSGAQANAMLKTSSPRLRDRSLIVEDQCAEFGGKCFALSQAKDARVFTVAKKGIFGSVKEFMLSQLPDDVEVSVDSHTSSPIFSGDSMQLGFALNARGIIDGEELIRMVHPPREEELILGYREREEAKAKFMQEHPELLEKGAKKHK